MEQQSRGRRQVDLFNFSFLDILACVIGLLIFILTIVVVSGGGPSATRRAQEVSATEHQLDDARFAAQLAGKRRAEFERLLNRRAVDAMDPAAAASAVQGETVLLRNQADAMLAARLRAERQIQATQLALNETERASGVDPALISTQAESQQLDERTKQLQADADQLRQQKVKTTAVSYHIPRLQETHRRQVWAEISGDQLWFLKSDSFEQTSGSHGDVTYRRLPDAVGVTIGTDATLFAPDPLSGVDPDTVVLTFLVRPNGYAAFRKLREDAWSRGCAVNWIPLEAGEEIVLSPATHVFEQ
jgi:hypothetical protein